MRKSIFYLLISLVAATGIPLVVLAQTRSVSGTVQDDKGSPLMGATVSVKNSKISTTTDAGGSFKIPVLQISKWRRSVSWGMVCGPRF